MHLLARPLGRARREPGAHPRGQRDLLARPQRRPQLAVDRPAQHRRGARSSPSMRPPTPRTCIRFYLTDADNPTSIVSAIAQRTRERAHAAAAGLDRDVGAAQRLLQPAQRDRRRASWRRAICRRCCTEIKEACQTFTGITEGTFYRDQAWYFYRLGRYIERADQTTRLLDIEILRAAATTADVGRADRRRPVACAAALRLRLSRLSPLHPERSDAGARRRVSAVQPDASRARSISASREVDAALTELKSRYASAQRQRRRRGARSAARDSRRPLDRRRSSPTGCTNSSTSSSAI